MADLTLDKHILGEVVRKKLRDRRAVALAQWIHKRFQTSVRRACRMAEISQTSWYAKSTARDQWALRLRIREIAHARPGSAYLRIHVAMPRAERWPVNKKRVHRS